MSEPVFCLAFLQNMWVKDPERVRKAIEEDGEEFRRRFMRYALFAGCKTGRMITKAFGKSLVEAMEFEETTRVISGNPKEILPVDLVHMRNAIELHKPKVIIAFGAIAHNAMAQIPHAAKYIQAHHPASRHPDSYQNLVTAAKTLNSYL